jgi:diguanylate cyclase (GGDEF)-like protein
MDNDGKYAILAVDDERTNLLALHQILSPEYSFFTAKSGEEALARIASNKPDLILMDILMPGISGFEALEILKKSEDTRDIPVIIITGLDSEDDEEKGFLLGAVDYITKPFKNAIVKVRVRTHIQILRQIHTIEQLSMADALTNIPNRRCFNERLSLEWQRAKREKKPLSFLMMDVDKFKTYNDTYGHPQGDALLRAIAKIFQSAAKRSVDLAARLGGEEFGVLLPDTKAEAALAVAEQIRAGVEAARVPTADGKTLTTATISIGVVSMVPSGETAVEAFIAEADKNLYTAKSTGRNRVCSGGK